ncbi:MAG: hypothetical protein KIT68_02705 [Phycisphaeraceae bacterium]|nr:hypothetical protein [Phycisphaeraceae bacterium]
MSDAKIEFDYRRPAGEQVMEALRRARELAERKAVRRVAVVAAALLLALGGWFAYVQLRPIAVPDTEFDDIEDVLDFTLLSDDFNRLPLQERLALLKGVISRLKGMNDGDSGLMAAFAAGLSRPALEQLRKNAEKLFVDLWDSFAEEYETVKQADRQAFLDDAFVRFTKMAEDLSGFTMREDEGRRLSDAKDNAKRDAARLREGGSQPMQSRMVTRFMKDMQERGGPLAKPQQRDRMARFSRDMARHMRGQDIDTGKEASPGSMQPAPRQPRGPGGPQKGPAQAPPAPAPAPESGGGGG